MQDGGHMQFWHFNGVMVQHEGPIELRTTQACSVRKFYQCGDPFVLGVEIHIPGDKRRLMLPEAEARSLRDALTACLERIAEDRETVDLYGYVKT